MLVDATDAAASTTSRSLHSRRQGSRCNGWSALKKVDGSCRCTNFRQTGRAPRSHNATLTLGEENTFDEITMIDASYDTPSYELTFDQGMATAKGIGSLLQIAPLVSSQL